MYLVLARPSADVVMYGDLDAAAASMLLEAVDNARIAGCRRIRLHLDGPRAADECFIVVLRQLRRSCTKAGGSFEVEGHGLLSKTTMPVIAERSSRLPTSEGSTGRGA